MLPLAALMAYGDGFWVMSLREAAGAIERMDSPFQAWLRESTLFLPVFVIAVLAATSVALARFGPSPRRTRAVLMTALLVVAAGTLAGVVGLAVSSAYDFHLQSVHMEAMNAMRDEACDAACSAAQHRTDLLLQVRAVAVGGALMLVTNLVLVAWAVALRGGRMVLGTRLDGRSAPSSRIHDLRLLLVAGLVGSAAIHAAVIPEHLRGMGGGRLLLRRARHRELALGLLVLVRLDRLVLGAVVAVSGFRWRSGSSPERSVCRSGPRPGRRRRWDWPTSRAACCELVTLAVAVALWLHRSPAGADTPRFRPRPGDRGAVPGGGHDHRTRRHRDLLAARVRSRGGVDEPRWVRSWAPGCLSPGALTAGCGSAGTRPRS